MNDHIREGVTLLRARATMSLSELMDLVPRDGVIGFGWGPREAHWLRARAGILHTLQGPAPGDLFEVHLFDGAQSWRWLAVDGVGQAAWIGEDPKALPAGFKAIRHEPGGRVDAITRSFLLWGAATDAPRGGWTRLGSPRITGFWAPVEASAGAALEQVQYLGRLDRHGNVGVIDERWSALVASDLAPRASQGGAS